MIARCLDSTTRPVQAQGWLILAVGEYPRFNAPERSSLIEQALQDSLRHAASAMRARHPDFVDPHLRPTFVRMYVVDSRCKPHDHPIVNGGDQVMPRIAEKLVGRARVDGIVEDVGVHCGQDGGVPGSEELDFHGPA